MMQETPEKSLFYNQEEDIYKLRSVNNVKTSGKSIIIKSLVEAKQSKWNWIRAQLVPEYIYKNFLSHDIPSTKKLKHA